MPEYAQKVGKNTTRGDGARVRSLSAVRPASGESHGGQRGQQTLQAAMNQAPAVQAVAQLKHTLNQSGRVGQVAQLSTALREPHSGVLQARSETVQRVEEEELLQGKFETAQRVEEEELLQGKFDTVQRVEEEELLQGKFETAQREAEPHGDAAPNRTGMPDHLKAGIESLSGMDMSGVRVHANSDKPAGLNALAYAQGADIHLGRGQEQHLPHEAWHVVQQAQGRVAATMQMQGVNINDDTALEAEADRMGAQASQMKKDATLS